MQWFKTMGLIKYLSLTDDVNSSLTDVTRLNFLEVARAALITGPRSACHSA